MEATLDTKAVRQWKRYEAYQDIDTAWVTTAPEHWEFKRLKWTIDGCQNGIWGGEPTGEPGEDLGCVRVADFDRDNLVVTDEIELTMRSIPFSKREGRQLERGDLLLEKSGGGDLQPVGAVVLFDSDAESVCSNFVAKVSVPDDYSSSFLRYLHAGMYAARVNKRSLKQSTGIQNLDSGQYFDEKMALPPHKEQRAIAAFLDRETARIDALIGHKERLIALLEEKRQAVISHAVTRGLDPNAKMKDSGVEWYSRRPRHWRYLPIGWLSDVCNGSTPSQSKEHYWADGTIPWISSGEVNNTIVSEPSALITEEAFRESSLRMIPSGSVLMGMIGQGKTRGTSALLSIDACINQNLAAIIPGDELTSEYLRFSLVHLYEPIRQMARGGNQGALNCDLVRSIRILVPPTDEQNAIVKYLNDVSQKINDLTDLLLSHNRMLHEYRTALISAAVTGQIDVREEVNA